MPLNPANGSEGPLRLALIDEDWCIGCTLCIKACPVDCIVGAPKLMHTVIGEQCTGCELCIPACPVDCIAMVDASGARAPAGPRGARRRRRRRANATPGTGERLRRDQIENDERLAAKAQAKLDDLRAASAITDPQLLDSKRAIVEAALARARRQREI